MAGQQGNPSRLIMEGLELAIFRQPTGWQTQMEQAEHGPNPEVRQHIMDPNLRIQQVPFIGHEVFMAESDDECLLGCSAM